MSTSRNEFFSRLRVALVLVGLVPLTALGQGLGNSPYSSLGIGEIYGNNNIINMGMGGLGVANANVFFLNTVNPALLARNQNTIFEVGLLGQAKQLADIRQSQRDFGANLSYLGLAFPVTGKWSMGLSLRPHSYVDYQTTQYEKVPGTIYDYQKVYRGRGGLNRATWTNGFQVGKTFYAGVEASFVFGNISNDAESQLVINGVNDITVSRSTLTSYNDIALKLGAAWRPKLSKNWFLNVGATYDPQTRMKGRETDTYQQLLGGSELSLPDTLRNNISGRNTLPSQFRAGIAIEKALNLTAGVEFTYQPWSKYRGLTGQSAGFNDSYTLAAGMQWLPKTASENYLNLINYRAGVAYTRLPYVINGKPVNDMSVSLGFSLPVGQLVNSVNLSLTGGQRGTLTEGQIRERYIKIGLGLSLNDRWFQRFVVD